jgi:hypothetical protein
MINTKGRRSIALRIEVDEEHSQPAQGECRRQIHTGRRLADAALLVGDDEDPSVRRRR